MGTAYANPCVYLYLIPRESDVEPSDPLMRLHLAA